MTIRAELVSLKDKKRLESILLVYMLVATSMLVVFPLSIPKATAQVTHLATASQEDMAGMPYDTSPIGDGVVVWDPNEDHIINHLDGYTIEAGMTLNIPPLNYLTGDPNEHEITITGFSSLSKMRIDVYGTLITNLDSLMPPTYTAFLGEGLAGWDGIYFHSGSEGRIYDTLIKKATYGVVFEPGSTIMAPGVAYSNFEDIGDYGMRMDGVSGYTRMESVQFLDGSNPSAIGLDVANGNLDMKYVFFLGHGPGRPGLRISNATVKVEESQFNGDSQPGNVVLIKGGSNGTILDQCTFLNGAAGDHYVRVEGSSNLIRNSRLKTSGGARSVIANENAQGIPAHPVLLNPTGEGGPGNWDDTFDNSTMNATGSSSVTLQWYMNVNVVDPDGNPIDNAPVWVKDRLGNPAEPSSKTTDASGWAGGFIVTELIQYESSVTNFNPFNVSALNNSMIGYTEPTMNMSKEVTVIVPFNPVSNTPPIVSWLPTPVGVQSDYIAIDFMLEDPDPGDGGNMSIIVEYSTDGISWQPAISGPGSDLNRLYNNTLYHFIWGSCQNLGNGYFPTVYIRITPRDRAGNGTPRQTGDFKVDNKAPIVSWLPTPVGVQSGYITFDFMLEDPNPGDDGKMSIIVEYSTDGISWQPAISGPGSDLNGLKNNTLYHFVWDSSQDLENIYSTTVYMKIIPRDRAGNGTPSQTGNFKVDNKAPVLLTGPVVTPTNTTALIEWTVDESANASVRYGFYVDGTSSDLTDEAWGSTGSTLQSVQLTDLQPGRNYTFAFTSTDIYGNQASSLSGGILYTFETEIHIQLYKGWNMISIPPYIPDPSLTNVLAPIIGQYDAVQWYDASDSSDPWKHNRPGKPYGNDLDMVVSNMGLWIHMVEDTTFVPEHWVPDPGYFEFITLFKGWNFVGYPSVTARDVTTALAGVPYDMVQTYDAVTGQWLSYDGSSGSLSQMEMGRGYWIHCTASSIWQVDYV